MATFQSIANGDDADASSVQQLIDALSGAVGKGVPIAITAVDDPLNFALTVRNIDATNGKAAIVYAADGTTVLLQVDKNGVKASPTGGADVAAIVNTTATQTLTNKTLGSGSVVPASLVTGVPVKIATLSGAAASYDFTSIPATYKHLFLEVSARSDTAATSTGLLLQFNADTAAHYDHQRNTIAAAVVSPSETFAASSIVIGNMPAASAAAGFFCVTRIEIPNYADTNAHKAVIALNSNKTGTASGSLFQETCAGFWRSAFAINEVKLTPTAGSFVTGAIATLYGMP